jgi:hypothetical protein
MTPARTMKIFRLLDRGFWLIWLAFPLFIWSAVAAILAAPEITKELVGDDPVCLAGVPMLDKFTLTSQIAYWSVTAIEVSVYAAILFLVHRVIHRCASGQVFVQPMIRFLRRIGWIISIWPVVAQILYNLLAWLFYAQGDMPAAYWITWPDLPAMGVGLLLVTLSYAMDMAVQMHDEAQLTV